MKTPKLNPELVIRIVNDYTKKDVLKDTKTRKREHVEPRQMAMYFLHKYTRLSLADVGRYFDKHHATVLHAVRHIPNFIEYDKDLRNLYVSIRSNILENAATLIEYSPDTRFKNIADDLTSTKRLNAQLVHRAINIKGIIDSMPNDIRIKYFGNDKHIHTTKQEHNGVAMVRKR